MVSANLEEILGKKFTGPLSKSYKEIHREDLVIPSTSEVAAIVMNHGEFSPIDLIVGECMAYFPKAYHFPNRYYNTTDYLPISHHFPNPYYYSKSPYLPILAHFQRGMDILVISRELNPILERLKGHKGFGLLPRHTRKDEVYLTTEEQDKLWAIAEEDLSKRPEERRVFILDEEQHFDVGEEFASFLYKENTEGFRKYLDSYGMGGILFWREIDSSILQHDKPYCLLLSFTLSDVPKNRHYFEGHHRAGKKDIVTYGIKPT